MVAINYIKDHVQINQYSRSGDKLLRVQALVIHYTANKGGTALMHANFFDGADGGNYRYAGAHIFVDKDEAREIIPLDEVGYHANERKPGPLLSALNATASYYPKGNANLLTLGIEMCIEKDGSFHPDTIKRTILVIKRLQEQFPQLKDTKNRVVRHYDVTGKICPKPFVDNPAAWRKFLEDIDKPIVLKQGWEKRADKWVYFKDDALVKNDWVRYKDAWYFLGADGIMYDNQWIKWKNKWYFLKPGGAMLVNDCIRWKNKWYCVGDNGAMHEGTLELGKDGEIKL